MSLKEIKKEAKLKNKKPKLFVYGKGGVGKSTFGNTNKQIFLKTKRET